MNRQEELARTIEQPDQPELRWLMQEYEACKAETEAHFMASLVQLYGLDGLESLRLKDESQLQWHDRNNRIRFGKERKGDDEMVKAILKRALNQQRQQRVLEVAAGTTMPRTHREYGAPWVSRRLMRFFADHLDITAVDLVPNNIHGQKWTGFMSAYVAPDGLFYHTALLEEFSSVREFLNDEDSVGKIVASPLVRDGQAMRFDPIDPAILYRIDDLYETLFSFNYNFRPLDSLRRKSGFDPLTEGRVYIRPSVDTELEQELFGLRMLGDVDIRTFQDQVDPASFDIVIARHIDINLKQPVFDELQQRVLKPDGLMLYSGDKPQKPFRS